MRWLRLRLGWLRTPFRLAHFPGVAAAVVASALILAGTATASRLFLASTGDAAFSREFDARREALRFESYEGINEDLLAEEDRIARSIPDLAPRLGPPNLVIAGGAAVLHGGRRHPDDPAADDVQLGYRAGFTAHIRPLARASKGQGQDQAQGDSQGIWITDTTARALGLRAGDRVTLSSGLQTAATRVAGVYHNIVDDTPDPFWEPIGDLIYAAQQDIKVRGPSPPPLVLTDLPLLMKLTTKLQSQGRIERVFYTTGPPLSLVEAERLAAGIGDITGQMADAFTPVALLFQNPRGLPKVSSPVPGAVARAEAVRTAVSPTALTVARFGQVMALALLVMAALYGVRRRRAEIAVLSTMGARSWALGTRAMVEAALPLALGTAGGLTAGVAFARVTDPAPFIDPAVVHAAIREAELTGLAGLALFGVATWASVAAEPSGRMGVGEWRGAARLGAALSSRPTWELVVLAVAGAAVYETATRRGAVARAGGVPQVDELLILAPLLVIGGLAAVVTRLLGWLLARRPLRGLRGRPAVLLASRRLAAAPRLALLLVAASAFAVGVLAYAGILVASVKATVNDKARVLVGSDASVTVPASAFPSVRSAGLAAMGATPVVRFDGVMLQPDQTPVDVLAVDPATFGAGTWWKPSYATVPLGELLRRLSDTSSRRLPAISVGAGGGFVAPEALSVSIGVPIPLSIVGGAAVFPGLHTDHRLLVVSAALLQDEANQRQAAGLASLGGRFEVWAKGDPARALRRLRAAGVGPFEDVITARQVMATTTFQAMSWSFGLLEAVGGVAVLVTLAGLLLYLQARQRGRVVAGALARRMGLARAAQRRSVAIELAGMLLVALVVGVALALVAALLVFARLDPLPAVPPGPALRLPVGLFGLLLAGVVLVAVAGAALVQRLSDRTSVAEMMRLAT
jgi:putative ABC transport system permease protein